MPLTKAVWHFALSTISFSAAGLTLASMSSLMSQGMLGYHYYLLMALLFGLCVSFGIHWMQKTAGKK